MRFDADTGDGWLGPIRFAGNEEREFKVTLTWFRENNIIKDWSLTAWGTQADISVRHSDPNIQSGTLQPFHNPHPRSAAGNSAGGNQNSGGDATPNNSGGDATPNNSGGDATPSNQTENQGYQKPVTLRQL